MANYAVLDENNQVLTVFQGKDETDLGVDGKPVDWEKYYNAKRTNYNTKGGVHYTDGEASVSQEKAFRKNYAGVGYSYDPVLDAFLPPKPHASWLVEESTGSWKAPKPYPDDGKKYSWDEKTESWASARAIILRRVQQPTRAPLAR